MRFNMFGRVAKPASVDPMEELRRMEERIRQAGHDALNEIGILAMLVHLHSQGITLPEESGDVNEITKTVVRNVKHIFRDLRENTMKEMDIHDVYHIVQCVVAHLSLRPDMQEMAIRLQPLPENVSGEKMLASLVGWETILTNLAVNARRKGAQALEIGVSRCTEKGRPMICIDVHDDGEGMQPHILQAIRQGKEITDKTAEEGEGAAQHGIGLTSVRTIVEERYGGHMKVESSQDAEKHGTTFTFLLPTVGHPERTMTRRRMLRYAGMGALAGGMGGTILKKLLPAKNENDAVARLPDDAPGTLHETLGNIALAPNGMIQFFQWDLGSVQVQWNGSAIRPHPDYYARFSGPGTADVMLFDLVMQPGEKPQRMFLVGTPEGVYGALRSDKPGRGRTTEIVCAAQEEGQLKGGVFPLSDTMVDSRGVAAMSHAALLSPALDAARPALERIARFPVGTKQEVRQRMKALKETMGTLLRFRTYYDAGTWSVHEPREIDPRAAAGRVLVVPSTLWENPQTRDACARQLAAARHRVHACCLDMHPNVMGTLLRG